jgi:hypothetical protein
VAGNISTKPTTFFPRPTEFICLLAEPAAAAAKTFYLGERKRSKFCEKNNKGAKSKPAKKKIFFFFGGKKCPKKMFCCLLFKQNPFFFCLWSGSPDFAWYNISQTGKIYQITIKYT